MSKRVGCLAVFVGGFVLYAGWVSYPPSRYESAATDVMNRCRARQELEQKTAQNATTNAFLDADFLPYWGRKGKEAQENSPVKAQLTQLDPYSDMRSGEQKGLESAVKAKDPKVEAVFADFTVLYKKIHAFCNKPEWIVPLDHPLDAETIVPNFISMRSIEQYLSTYAEYLALKGDSDQALEVAGDMLRFGWLVSRDQGALIQLMISVATESVGQSCLAMVLQTAPEGSPAALESIFTKLEECHFKSDAFVEGMEGEYYMCANTLLRLTEGGRGVTDGGVGTDAFLRIPGLVGREIRLFENDYLPLLEQIRQGQIADVKWIANFGVGSWLLGQHGYLSAVLIPNFTRANTNVSLLRKRQAFLYLYVGLLRAHQAGGKWPASLKDLQDSGFKPLDGLDLSTVVYSAQGEKMELKLSLTRAEVPNPPMADSKLQEWELLAGLEWTLHAPPPKRPH